MDIDGKQVEAELLPADKARTIYNDIVRKSKDPALLEYAGRDMFRVHIFPIPANGRKQITLKYTELLKQDNGLLDYHYTLNTEKFSSKPLQNVSLKVSVDCTEPITTLYSPTHEIDKTLRGDRSATVGFEAQNIRPDTDFHLFIGHKATPVGISLLSYRPDPTKEGYFVLLAAPTVNKDVKPMPKDVVFVMDTSGSMAGDKIEQVRTAMKYCVDTLNPQDRFDIMRFSTEAEPLFNRLMEANADNRKKADEFAAGLKAAGGTAIDEALTKALEERDNKDGRVFMLVFMTDGQPTVGEQNIDAILKHEQAAARGAQVRVFTFGVGTDVNTKLLDLMADQTRGYSQYVLPNEKLEVSMSNFWGKVQDPVIAGIKLDTGGVSLSKVYPKEMPDLFKGDQLVVFGSYDKPGKSAVTLTGMVNGVPQKFAQDVTFEERTDSGKEWIAKLWATRRVGYLLDEIRLHGESQELKDEVVDLARKWGVVTPYTAMLIIEDERARGVPLAQRSLREMEYDTRVALNTAGASYSMKDGDVAGSTQAVANGINTMRAEELLELGSGPTGRGPGCHPAASGQRGQRIGIGQVQHRRPKFGTADRQDRRANRRHYRRRRAGRLWRRGIWRRRCRRRAWGTRRGWRWRRTRWYIWRWHDNNQWSRHHAATSCRRGGRADGTPVRTQPRQSNRQRLAGRRRWQGRWLSRREQLRPANPHHQQPRLLPQRQPVDRRRRPERRQGCQAREDRVQFGCLL